MKPIHKRCVRGVGIR